jgi:hypothetical protein
MMASSANQYRNPRRVLADLLNLPTPERPDYAEANAAFDRRHGELRRGQLQGTAPAISGMFRRAWEHRDAPSGHDEINLSLGDILNSPVEGKPTALYINIVDGTVTPEPRDLLDALAVEFLHSYRSIAPCEREDCTRLFIREFPNDRYCSRRHADEARRTAQRDFMRKLRAKQKEQKTKTGKTRRKA